MSPDPTSMPPIYITLSLSTASHAPARLANVAQVVAVQHPSYRLVILLRILAVSLQPRRCRPDSFTAFAFTASRLPTTLISLPRIPSASLSPLHIHDAVRFATNYLRLPIPGARGEVFHL